MPLVLPQTYSLACNYITGLKPDIFRKFTIPLAPEVMSTITHDNLLKHDPAILLRSRKRRMPKRTDIKSIMIIGAGPIVIGQACEFDYSGAQACKALREEGYRVILVNSNPATIMTDPELADATYIEPITAEVVAKIIEKERPDALLPTMGGQTGLNTACLLYTSDAADE